MTKPVLVVMAMASGYAEGAAEQVKNIAHYVVVRDIRSGSILAKCVVEQV
jgi:hypothetical protein